MFNTCRNCDFEWHSKDGVNCPACGENFDHSHKVDDFEENYKGGAFGTGENGARIKNWYAALGIIALVYVIYSYVLN
jgi:hypothetical protein